MVRAYESHERVSDDLSYQDITHNVRVALGGRVAEHLLLGPMEVSARGSQSDMKSATQMAGSLFAKWGHSIDISTDTKAASNLAVCIGAPSESECAYTEKLIRSFLQTQFGIVLEMLKQHSDVLYKLVHELNEKTVLVKEDFIDLLQGDQRT
jgi:ATP-dependent Zn protease